MSEWYGNPDEMEPRMKPVNPGQNTAETWEIAAPLLTNTQMPVLFKDQNGIYHTVNGLIGSEIVGGIAEYAILSGEIVDPQPAE